MSKLVDVSRKAVETWCDKQGIKLVSKPNHVYPRAYVIGLVGPKTLIVARPWVDSEPHMRQFDAANDSLSSIYTFDPALKAGMWCTTAYVRTKNSGEPVAIPVVEI